jgi:hypothetical protein
MSEQYGQGGAVTFCRIRKPQALMRRTTSGPRRAWSSLEPRRDIDAVSQTILILKRNFAEICVITMHSQQIVVHR